MCSLQHEKSPRRGFKKGRSSQAQFGGQSFLQGLGKVHVGGFGGGVQPLGDGQGFLHGLVGRFLSVSGGVRQDQVHKFARFVPECTGDGSLCSLPVTKKAASAVFLLPFCAMTAQNYSCFYGKYHI